MRVDELSAIPQASREIALQSFELLRPHLEGVRPLRAVASEASIPYRTAVRWASGYRKDGLVALARKSRTDQGERRLASTQLIEAIEGLALAINGLETLSVDVVETARENLVIGQA